MRGSLFGHAGVKGVGCQYSGCVVGIHPSTHPPTRPRIPSYAHVHSYPQVAAKKPASAAWGDLEQGSGYSSEAGMGLAELSTFVLRKGLAQMGRWGSRKWAGGAHFASNEATDNLRGYAFLWRWR